MLIEGDQNLADSLGPTDHRDCVLSNRAAQLQPDPFVLHLQRHQVLLAPAHGDLCLRQRLHGRHNSLNPGPELDGGHPGVDREQEECNFQRARPSYTR